MNPVCSLFVSAPESDSRLHVEGCIDSPHEYALSLWLERNCRQRAFETL